MDTIDEINYINDVRVNHFTGVDNHTNNVNYHNNFNILYFNIQSLRNKLNNLEILINSYTYEIHAIVLTEIWIN